MEFFLCKWPFQRRICENSGRGGGIWSPLCPNGCFREVFVKIAVVEEEFRLLSAKERYLFFCIGLSFGKEVLNSGSFVEQLNLR